MEAHAADLGMTFYSGSQFPAKYRGGIFSAQHGSWNRKQPDGYKLYRVRMENGHAVSWEEFVEQEEVEQLRGHAAHHHRHRQPDF